MKKKNSLFLLAAGMCLLTACGTQNAQNTEKLSFEINNNSGMDITEVYIWEGELDNTVTSDVSNASGDPIPVPPPPLTPNAMEDEKEREFLNGEKISDGEIRTVTYDLYGEAEIYWVEFKYTDGTGTLDYVDKSELEKGGTWELTGSENYTLTVTPNENSDKSELSFEVKNESKGELLELYIASEECIWEKDTLENLLGEESVKSGESRVITYEYDPNIDDYRIGWNIKEYPSNMTASPVENKDMEVGGTIVIEDNLSIRMTFTPDGESTETIDSENGM